MLRNVRSRLESWPLASPFRISRGVKTVAEVVTVEIAEGGALGRGEAVPYARYGETPDSVMAQLLGVEQALADGLDRAELSRLLPPGAARNAADCALWDLEAQLSGRSVAEAVCGGRLRPLITALTVSLDQPERMGEAAAPLAGARLIKVKVDAGEPEACLRAVREKVPDAALIVDPNESWDLRLLERLQPVLSELRTTFIEQPLPAGEDGCLEGLGRLVPICADESCHTAADLHVLERRYDMVNVKLDKTGGLTEAVTLIEAARGRGLGVMVGCMISSSLSIAPAFHIAALADHADLDGPLWLKEDRPGGVAMHEGLLAPPQPGFWGAREER